MLSILNMKKLIFICIIIILFTTSACENKINEETISQSDDIKQVEETEQTESERIQPTDDIVAPNEIMPTDEIDKTESTEPKPQQSNLQWPKDFIPKVPVLEGEITSLNFDVPREGDEVQEPQYVRIELANIEEDDADEFIEGLKNNGFTQNAVYEKNEYHTKYYVQELGVDYDFCRVLFKWNPIDKSALTVLLKPGFLALSAYIYSYEDTADEDLGPWPEGFLENYPEPKGKIIDVTFSEVDTEAAKGTQYDIIFFYGDKQSVLDCIEEIKKSYYVEADEIIMDNFIMYDGISSFRDTDKYHHAYIGYEDISDSPYISILNAPEGKFRITTVSMYKEN